MVSLCMIVRDEEDVIERCLRSCEGLFGEVVVVDTGSRDNTRDIAERLGANVYDFPWQDDFSAARNFSLSKAHGEWLFWLDADDVIDPDQYPAMKAVIDCLDSLPEQVTAVMLPYRVAFDEAGRVALEYDRERILRAGRGLQFAGEIHEAVPVFGETVRKDAAVSHRKIKSNEPGRNLRILEKILGRDGRLSPRLTYYYGRELRAAGRIAEAAERFSECFYDSSAWLENRISSGLELYECLEELGNKAGAEFALGRLLLMSPPRADACCAMGLRFLRINDLQSAAFWYSLAPRQYKEQKGGFVHADFGGYIPYMQLAVIYDRLGEYVKAAGYNELAGKIHPSAEYLQNKRYFDERLRACSQHG